jgi:hypothetical protein
LRLHRRDLAVVAGQSIAGVMGVMCLVAGYPTRSFAENGNGAEDAIKAYGPFLGSREFIIAVLVLLFGAFLTIASGCLLRYTRIGAEELTRLMSLILVVCGLLLLVATGYRQADIAPALGLLGTIAGYLLGRSDRQRPSNHTGTEKTGHES